MFVRNGQRLGSVLVERTSAGPAGQLTETEQEADRQAALAGESQREDGVHSVGGGWHEVVVDGQVVDKVRGADAAQEAYEARKQEGRDGDDQLP
jgi:hypothetical protein